MFTSNYKCSQCDAKYEITPELMLCPECEPGQKRGEPLKGVLEVELNGTPISDDPLVYLQVEREFFPDIPP